MPIDFFQLKCKTESDEIVFGLCDKPHPLKEPAYIDPINQHTWIATVNNPNAIHVDFYAIDHCVEIKRVDGTDASRCEGMMHYDQDNITFVELKDAVASRWLKKGRMQLTASINDFAANNNLANFKVKAYIANKQHPLTSTSYQQQIERFNDDTGLILQVEAAISI